VSYYPTGATGIPPGSSLIYISNRSFTPSFILKAKTPRTNEALQLSRFLHLLASHWSNVKIESQTLSQVDLSPWPEYLSAYENALKGVEV